MSFFFQRSLLTLGEVMPGIRSSWPWIAAGVGFATYPAVRPYADETTYAGLAVMASDAWLLAHLLGVLAFAALPIGLSRLGRRLAPEGSRAADSLGPLSYLALVLLLPYYGAETFGLHAIGQYARPGDPALLTVVDGVRYQPVAIILFGLGLLTLAVVGVLLAITTWSQGAALRAAGLVSGVGLALYLPQFFGTPTIRVAHGVLLGLGCLAIGFAARSLATAAEVPAPQSAESWRR
jgi:hypothetical protein